MRGCLDCGGTDEAPPRHTTDCPQLERVAEGPLGRGCRFCGATGLATGPAFDPDGSEACGFCGAVPGQAYATRPRFNRGAAAIPGFRVKPRAGR